MVSAAKIGCSTGCWPLAWELELMEGCLRAVPDFVARHPQDDPAREEISVPVVSGPLRLVLSWEVEEG